MEHEQEGDERKSYMNTRYFDIKKKLKFICGKVLRN